MDDEERKKQSLDNKIENILPTLFNLINKPEFKFVKEKFIRPEKDEITGLFVFDEDLPIYTAFNQNHKSKEYLLLIILILLTNLIIFIRMGNKTTTK